MNRVKAVLAAVFSVFDKVKFKSVEGEMKVERETSGSMAMFHPQWHSRGFGRRDGQPVNQRKAWKNRRKIGLGSKGGKLK